MQEDTNNILEEEQKSRRLELTDSLEKTSIKIKSGS